ncbi:unnamed protein product [Caenorhabditis bovis]|uniref:PLD phosphodiesterase domain-containing protein n=1 Tax=Caenorhabditis bovis TaxID=2654633 RepID=A0A8S1EBK4_9PELO|nr:unnamed protein product [Caenorhabditis bovis]
MDLFDTRINEIKLEKNEEENKSKFCGSSRNSIIKPACVPITVLSLLIIALVFLPLFNEEDLASPIKLTTEYVKFNTLNSTADTWIKMIDSTEKYLDMSVMYWNLNTSDYETAFHGKQVYEALIRAAKRGVKVRIIQDGDSNLSDNKESKYLADNKLAEVRSINMTRLLGSGIVHTKFLISDIRTIYVGSANMDWKSLSEVKELGVVVENCPCVAADLYKIFSGYWKLGAHNSVIPHKWPLSYRTPYNFTHMGPLTLNGEPANYFISSSPQPFNPKGREHDLEAIRAVIKHAKETVAISVMDYIPTTLYMKNGNSFWPEIDDAVRDAAYRGVNVKMLISHWDHSRKEIIPFLRSLLAINDAMPLRHGKRGNIEIKIFTVPSSEKQKTIPFTRVNHAKYMVTEEIAYIGTSNWSGDYFITTAGVAIVFKQDQSAKKLQAIFDRDWNSEYAKLLS